LYLILLAGAWLTDEATGPAIGAGRARALAGASAPAAGSMPGRLGLGGTAGLGGATGGAALLGLGGWLAGPPQSRRARRSAARQSRRLRPGSRPGDGWISGGSHGALGGLGSQSFRTRSAGGRAMRGQAFSGRTVSSITRGGGPGSVPGGGSASRGGSSRGALSRGGHGSAVARLRSGVAGSAASGQVPRTLAARPVRLRLGGGRRLGGRGSVVVGRAMSRASLSRLGRRRTRGSGGFRPAIMPGGSAMASAGTRHPARVSLSPAAPVRFSARRRDGLVGGGVLSRASRAGTRAASPKLRIKDGLPAPRLTSPRGRPATPRFKRRPLSAGRPQTGRRPRFRHHPWSVMALLTRRRGGLLTPRRVRRGLGGAVPPDYRRAGAWRPSSKRTGGPE
jgi:hypothetical protein